MCSVSLLLVGLCSAGPGMVLARQLSGWEGILPLSVTVFCPLLVLLSDQARDNNEKKKKDI